MHSTVPMVFIFLSCRDNKEFSRENSKPAVNHEARPVKSNPVLS